VHVVRALRQALVLIAASSAGAAAAACVWVLAAGGSFSRSLGIALLVVAFLVGTAGGSTLSRAAADSERAFLGLRPERDEFDGAAGLTGLGIFLFVGVPLFVLGTAALGMG
jgi:hypothetical protein